MTDGLTDRQNKLHSSFATEKDRFNYNRIVGQVFSRGSGGSRLKVLIKTKKISKSFYSNNKCRQSLRNIIKICLLKLLISHSGYDITYTQYIFFLKE